MKILTIDRAKEWTVEEYLQLEEMTTPCQLINGKLIMRPAPAPEHQRTLRRLFKLWDACIKSGEIFFAPADLFIDIRNVMQPDLIYISEDKKQIITNRGIEGVPDMIAEIISPSTIFTDRNQKKNIF